MTPAQRAEMEGQIRARAILNDGFGYTLAAALAHIDAQAATIADLVATLDSIERDGCDDDGHDHACRARLVAHGALARVTP